MPFEENKILPCGCNNVCNGNCEDSDVDEIDWEFEALFEDPPPHPWEECS